MVSESGSVLDDDEKMNFHNDLAMRSKPSCIHPPNPDELEIPTGESILGLVKNSNLKQLKFSKKITALHFVSNPFSGIGGVIV